MKRLILAVWIVAAMTSGCSAAAGEDGYSIVYSGAVAMRKLPAGKGLVTFPWLDPQETLFWTCGFAKMTYNEVPVDKPLDSYADASRRRVDFYYMTGEWCDVGPALFEEPHYSQNLIWYRRWRGKRYILLHARVYQDGAGFDYVADKALLEWAELQPLARDVVHGEGNTGCFSPQDAQFEEYKADLVQAGDEYCFKSGVLIRDLAVFANKPLQRTRSKQRASER